VSIPFFHFFFTFIQGYFALENIGDYRLRLRLPARRASIAACEGASAVRLVGIPSALRARQT
jgi:hypothetical protein